MRLIDGDVLQEKLKEMKYRCRAMISSDGEKYGEILAIVMKTLDDMPTIVPPPNDPLTLEELREMDGEPVWCEKFGWRICYMVSDFRGYPCMELGAGGCIRLDDYGLDWRAYRRKPSE